MEVIFKLIKWGLEHTLFITAAILLVVFIVIWSFHFLALAYGKYKFHKKCKRPLENAPGVSILKPLMGVDDNLRDNLETFFTLDYPLFELLFCVSDPSDPAILVVRSLIEQYPNVDAKLFFGGKPVGINPKINNLVQGYDVAKYELLLISDAGLRMAEDTLSDMVSLLTDKIGLVHQMPFTCDRPGFSGSLEKVYFGTCHCRMYLFINLIGVNCVTGMSCLMRKSVLDKCGGLKSFGVYIAEDYFIAKAYIDDNWTIQLSHQPAMQNAANYSVPTWQNRMIRWCKLRLRLTPMAWFEPMQECFMLGIFGSWSVNYLFGWNSLVFFLIHVLCWFLSDYTLLKITQNGKLPFNKFEYLLCWLYRETICFYLFLKAAYNPTVKWRDGTYRLKWGGLSELVKDKKRENLIPNDVVNNKLPASPLIESSMNKNNSSPASTASDPEKASDGIIVNGASLSNGISNGVVGKKSALGHKRTSSYSVIMKSSNSLSNPYNSDVENNSPSVPLLRSSPQNNTFITTNSEINNKPNYFTASKANPTGDAISAVNRSQPTAINGNSHYQHQHHHSISAPVSSSTSIQLSKKYDI